MLPGTQSASVAGVPQPPILETPTTPPPKTHITPAEAPLVPPTPAEVNAVPPTLPPTGTGTAQVTHTPPPKRPRRRIRNFFLTLFFLLAGGYAGSVYYALVNDNFHDFFTEYVPYGEEAVAYFEERSFRKRFPLKDTSSSAWPQVRGEHKVTIGRASGISPRIADVKDEKAGSDLAASGRHVSAVQDNDTKASGPAPATTPSKSAKEAPKVSKAPASASTQAPALAPAAAKAEAPAPVKQIDHVNVAQATEPVIQELVKMVNNIITTVNASPEAAKYASTITTAKQDLNKIIGEIGLLKDKATQEAQSEINKAHTEFDGAAKELVRRLEGEMKEQEARWRDEYEAEREKLSNAYQSKLTAELDAAKKVAESKRQNELLELEIALQKKFSDSIKASVEAERDGRLSKLDQLSTSVGELEKLTGQWNDVVDANLRTQHLHVALEAVRNAVEGVEHATPFVDELVALKEISRNNEVVSAAIASISPSAYQRGVPTPAHIIDRFRRVASEVRKASLLPEDAGIASHAASALVSRLMFSKKSERGLPEGDDVESTLARTETLLEEGDLEAAAREMNGLKGWAGVLSRDWIAEARKVLEVKQAVDVGLLGLCMCCANISPGHECRSPTTESPC